MQRSRIVVAAALLVLAVGVSVKTQGGGAVHTPGAFSVSDDGATTYTIPIEVPPGIAGLAPKLALVYSSNARNGLLGQGWNLSGLSSINRCPQTMVQDGAIRAVAIDANDRFCLDGQRLVGVAGTYGANNAEYRTEHESYSKIISTGTAGTGPASFSLYTKAGHRMDYGVTSDARIVPAVPGSTAIVWLLNRIEDKKGNYLTISYTKTEGATGYEYRPSQIQYTGNGAQAPTNSVSFQYETRLDISTSYTAGALAKLTQRLTEIRMFVPGNATAVRKYVLTYIPSQPAEVPSRLQTVQVTGAAGGQLLPTTFTWHGQGQGYAASDTQLASSVGWYGINPRVSLADLNGDGRADLVYANASTYLLNARLSQPAGGLGSAVAVGGLYALNGVTDINGDGRADPWENDIYQQDDPHIVYMTISFSLSSTNSFGAKVVCADWYEEMYYMNLGDYRPWQGEVAPAVRTVV